MLGVRKKSRGCSYLPGLVQGVGDHAVVPAERVRVGEGAGLDAVVDRLHPAAEVGAARLLRQGRARVGLVSGPVLARAQVHEEREVGRADGRGVLGEAGDLGWVPVLGHGPGEGVVAHCAAGNKRRATVSLFLFFVFFCCMA